MFITAIRKNIDIIFDGIYSRKLIFDVFAETDVIDEVEI